MTKLQKDMIEIQNETTDAQNEITQTQNEITQTQNEITETQNEISVNSSLSFRDLMFVRSMPYHPVVQIVRGILIFTAIFEGLSLLTWHTWLEWPYWAEGIVLYPLIFFAGLNIDLKRYGKELSSKITLTKDYIIGQTIGGNEGKFEWRAVQRIMRKADAVVIQVSRKPDYYYWIPDRCFPTPHDAEEFYLTAKEHWENLRFAGLPELYHDTPITDDAHSADATITTSELIRGSYFLFSWLAVLGLISILLCLGEMVMFHTINTLSTFGMPGLLCLALPGILTWLRVKDHPEWLSSRVIINKDEIIMDGKESGLFNRHAWSSVKKIRTWSNMLLVTLDTNWTMCIPLRNFPTTQSAKEFCALSEKYWKEAKAKPPKLSLDQGH